MRKVYLVIDCETTPGQVLAVMASEEDAHAFAGALVERADVEERTVIYGQPSRRGFNP